MKCLLKCLGAFFIIPPLGLFFLLWVVIVALLLPFKSLTYVAGCPFELGDNLVTNMLDFIVDSLESYQNL